MKEFLYEAVTTALIRSVPVATFGLLLLALLRRGSGASRHMVCAATLAVLFALPILNLIPQRQDIALPSVGTMAARPLEMQPPSIDRVAATPVFGGAVGHAGPSVSIAQLLAGIYVFGLLILALRQIRGIRAAAQAVKTSTLMPSDSRYPVRLSSSISVPMATWWRESTVLLPIAAANWPESRLKASIEHESAHIRRGDLIYTTLASLIKLIYWPNILVWFLSAKLVESAELATDDCVLGSGLSPTDYADVLVLTASERRSAGPIFSLSMARSSKVGRRVRAILDPVRRRGSAHPLGILLTGVLLVSGSLSLGRFNSHLHGLNKIAIPTAVYDDIQLGLTVPAEASNNFTAVDAAGRKIQLVQIQRWTQRGPEAWKPDGTRLPSSDVLPDDWKRHDPTELHLISRFAKNPLIDGSNAGIGSGPSSPNDPPMLVFSGGYEMASPDSNSTETMVSFLGVPKPGSSGKVSVTFGYSERSAETVATVYPSGDQPNRDLLTEPLKSEFVPDFFSTVHVEYPTYGTPFVWGPKHEAIPDGHGDYLRSKVLSTKLTYTERTYRNGNHQTEPVAYRVNTLAKIDQDWNDAHQRETLMDHSIYWPVAPKDIDHIDILVHKTYHVAYLNIAVRPNQAGP